MMGAIVTYPPLLGHGPKIKALLTAIAHQVASTADVNEGLWRGPPSIQRNLKITKVINNNLLSTLFFRANS